MLKLKVRKFWRLIPTFVKVTGEKLVPILNSVKKFRCLVFIKHKRLTVKKPMKFRKSNFQLKFGIQLLSFSCQIKVY